MSKHDFSWAEFCQRRTRVRAAMGAAELDWLVLFHPVSIHWLTGSDAKSYQEFQCLLVSAEDRPITVLTREGECNEYRDDAFVDEIVGWGGGRVDDPVDAFSHLARSRGLTQSRVGIEVPAYYLHSQHYLRIRDLLGKSLAADATEFVHRLKLVKSPAELAYIRRAAEIADSAMQVFVEALRVGRSELEIAGDVYRSLLVAGSGLAASPMNLVSGERSGFSHGAPTERRLKAGDFGSVEYGATYRRYTATIGRQFCLGRPTSRMIELYDVVRRASDACIAEIRAGVRTSVPHGAAKRAIVAAGLERGRVHTTGYGLAPGFPPTWGEPLHMIDGADHVLQAGMVVTVEPPVFLGDERLGARIIDNVLVTESGAEVLTRFNRDLILA
jgi:Xaa-Pro dipeptidase